MTHDFLSMYLKYTDETECPVIYSRWAAIAGIGALLGRKTFIQLGHFKVFPNIYCMLMGGAGARKSSTISIQKKLLTQVGYNTIAADKSSKEKFLLDLAGEGDNDGSPKAVEDFLWSSPNGESGSDREILIAADEFNNFLGGGNLEFLSLLGVLWDYDGVYKNRIKTGKSISITNPTVSILAGNTPSSFHRAFPPEAIGQGFFSRLLLIHGEPRDRRYAFPIPPSEGATKTILGNLSQIASSGRCSLSISTGARKRLESIYEYPSRLTDVRFESYNTRRFTHLLKLCIIVHAADGRQFAELQEDHVIYANTILSHVELYMPKALGNFGKARNSDVGHKVIQVIDNAAGRIVELSEIWKHVSTDLDSMSDLVKILQNLLQADHIQQVPGKGFLPKKVLADMSRNPHVDFGYLTSEEKEMKL